MESEGSRRQTLGLTNRNYIYTNSESQTYHGDQWVRVDVLVVRDSLFVHYVNGEEVMRYEKPQLDDGTLLTEGDYFPAK